MGVGVCVCVGGCGCPPLHISGYAFCGDFFSIRKAFGFKRRAYILSHQIKLQKFLRDAIIFEIFLIKILKEKMFHGKMAFKKMDKNQGGSALVGGGCGPILNDSFLFRRKCGTLNNGMARTLPVQLTPPTRGKS